MRHDLKKKKTQDRRCDRAGATEQRGALDESLRRELGGGAWRRNGREGLGLLKRRGFSLP